MTQSQTYTGVAIALHWVIGVLLISMVFFGWWMEGQSEALLSGEEGVSIEEVSSAYNWHKTTGILIFVLSLARLAWRLTHPVPPLPASMPGWQKLAANIVHIGFYALMIGLPIGGYVLASSFGDLFPILLFDAVQLPKLPVPQTSEFQDMIGSAHSAGGWMVLILFAIHLGAILKHEILDGTGITSRMLPFLDMK